jgi:pyoverdine/dityrosine biosynthesis protein Dit1
MAHSQFDTFLHEATYPDHAAGSSMDRDRLYGLYTSWCFVNQQPAGTESTFWAAMKHRIPPRRNGLRMKGPAAADYIMTSYPGLV